MNKQKKNGNQDPISKAVLITAILNLIKALIELINKLTE